MNILAIIVCVFVFLFYFYFKNKLDIIYLNFNNQQPKNYDANLLNYFNTLFSIAKGILDMLLYFAFTMSIYVLYKTIPTLKK